MKQMMRTNNQRLLRNAQHRAAAVPPDSRQSIGEMWLTNNLSRIVLTAPDQVVAQITFDRPINSVQLCDDGTMRVYTYADNPPVIRTTGRVVTTPRGRVVTR